MIWKNKTDIWTEKESRKAIHQNLVSPTHGLAVHLHNKKLKIFKLKEFFKFTLYTGFTYLFTRKLTKTPGSKASLHCFSGDVWSRGCWNCLFARPRPDRGWFIHGQFPWAILEVCIPYFRVSEKEPPRINIRVCKLVGPGPPWDGFVWPVF